MLNQLGCKRLFISLFAAMGLLQLIAAYHNQLFGDEAFYWLESQHLAWSYAELPGWTQWMIALSQWLFPQHPLSIRIFGLLAAFSIPWIGIRIAQKLNPESNHHWQAGLLLLTLPLLTLAGVLAIPDIWIIFFGLLSLLFLIHAIHSQQKSWYFILGLTLALAINVHVRFWIIILLAFVILLWQFRQNMPVIKNMLLITLPIGLLGLIPIFLFNLHNNFPLLAFQASDRHPWTFQPLHAQFFIVQILVATPWVFWLCFKTVIQCGQLNTLQRTITFLAVGHWLTYALMGFFTDNLRFNLHWPLFSYVILLVVAASENTQNRLKSWAIFSGIAINLVFFVWILFNLHVSKGNSQIHVNFTENAQGWEELANTTNKHLSQYDAVVVDNFMTLAELTFYLKTDKKITTLTHPQNTKHGRQAQLQIMGLIQSSSQARQLFVMEHTALKQIDVLPFYQSSCDILNGIKRIDELNHNNGLKIFYLFETGTGICDIPLAPNRPETTGIN